MNRVYRITIFVLILIAVILVTQPTVANIETFCIQPYPNGGYTVCR